MLPAAILDVDGTLVDTNYQHAIAWHRAFRRHGIVLPLWRIHRHIGMGGDQLVPALCGERVDAELGDKVRAAEAEAYLGELIEEVEPLDGARELVRVLKERGHPVVLASSAKAEEVERYVDLLDARAVADGWTTSADVDSTKPEPDLVAAAMSKATAARGADGVPAGHAVMVGDSTWDCRAARRAGLDTIGVLTGGFSEEELREAGAALVFESLPELCVRLEETPLTGVPAA